MRGTQILTEYKMHFCQLTALLECPVTTLSIGSRQISVVLINGFTYQRTSCFQIIVVGVGVDVCWRDGLSNHRPHRLLLPLPCHRQRQSQL